MPVEHTFVDSSKKTTPDKSSAPSPTPRPLFGPDDEEFSTRTNGPLQTGHANTKTGETVMDDSVAPWAKNR